MRQLRLTLLLCLAFQIIIPQFSTKCLAQQRRVPDSRSEVFNSYSPIVKIAAPAVVNVYVRQKMQGQRYPSSIYELLQQMYGLQPQEGQQQGSLGSGVIVRPNGIVVTNYHVIQGGGTDAEIKVALSDAREFDAKVLLKDERTDLAVLKIANSDVEFPYITFADADLAEVGDIVLAIGNPFGVGQTVTKGIVSALARTRVGVSDYQFFIQTDAAINPGNSGGALIDVQGRLLGINTVILSKSGGSQGIGFAIPSNMVRIVVDSAIQGGNAVKRPWLGASLEPLTTDMAAKLGLDRPIGALITSTYENSPAAEAGLSPGDVIVRADGHDVADPNGFFYRFMTKGIGGTVTVEAVSGGKKKIVSLPLITAPETPARDVREIKGSNPFSGARVINLSPAVAEEFSLNEIRGVAILETESYSIARRLGFQPGDIIVSVNGERIDNTRQLERVLARSARGWELTCRRGGQEFSRIFRAYTG